MILETEQALLGGLMIDNTAWNRIADLVSVNDFKERRHRIIFAAIEALIADNTTADAVTVCDRLRREGNLDAVGGLEYVGGLANAWTPSASNITSYAKLVRERALERRLVEVGGQIIELAKGEVPVAEKLDTAEALVMGLAERSTTAGPITASSVLPAVIDEIERRNRAGSGLVGLPTGFIDIDRMTTGLSPGDLIIVAGRPSSGKTTLAMNIAEHVAEGRGETVVVFSMEMSKEQLLMRSIASLERLDFQRLKSARLDDDEWPKITQATSRIAKAKLLIDDTAALRVTELRARARRVKREHELALVIVDYLQLMRGEGQNRNLEVAHISAGLKALAKELHVPVVALSQLNRDVTRDNRTPRLSDLRDSGAVEQDADVVLFVHRDEDSGNEKDNGQSTTGGIAEIIIGKQRNGPRGTVHLTFNGSQVRFENYAGPAIERSAARPRRWNLGFDD
jgi:replicative DNA helicase